MVMMISVEYYHHIVLHIGQIFLFTCRYTLDIVAVHEHDVVPVGPVHVQVDLPDVRRQSSGPGF